MDCKESMVGEKENGLCSTSNQGVHLFQKGIIWSIWFNEDLSSPFLCNELRFLFLNFKVLCRVYLFCTVPCFL